MNFEKWKAAKNNGVNLATCYHFGEGTGNNICGAMAVWHLPMPGNIPDMPLCAKHVKEYKNITQKEIIDIIVAFLLDEKEEGK